MLYGLIPARKGSKRIKDKNFANLLEKPLIEYTISAANFSKLQNIFISTDYEPEQIMKFYSDNNKFKYVRRDDQYCNDTVSSLTCVSDLYTKNLVGREDSIVLLQPTCPIRTSVQINEAMLTYMLSDKNVLLSLSLSNPLKKLYKEDLEKVVDDVTPYSAQEELKIYCRNSSIYIFKVSTYLDKLTIYQDDFEPFYMPKMSCIDIDTEEDLKLANAIIRGVK